MKNVFNLGFVLMLSLTLMSGMCSSDDDDGTSITIASKLQQ